jgi:hypothetical protein
MAFLLAITLASAFYTFEKSLPYQISDYVTWFLTGAVVIAWVWIAFTSGFMRRGAFIAVSLAYWTVPQFVIFGYAAFSQTDFNAYFYVASKISEVLVRAPLGSLTDALQISGFFTGISLLVLSEIVFFIGVVYRSMCKNFGWYCDFREQYEV